MAVHVSLIKLHSALKLVICFWEHGHALGCLSGDCMHSFLEVLFSKLTVKRKICS